LKTDGILALYKGLTTGLFGTVVSSGIYFFWYRLFKNLWSHLLQKKALGDFDVAVITLFSGVINSVLTNPIWFLNTRMSVTKDKKGIIETIKQIVKEEGIVAFYRGVLPGMVLVTNPIINFVIYENLKKWALKNKFSLSFIQLFLISSIAKAIATVATYPILTTRVKIQTSKQDEDVPRQSVLA
jgi:adenine nucleotide transporter 17